MLFGNQVQALLLRPILRSVMDMSAPATLGNLVKESLGPLPIVCSEKVLLDLERARMTAEDYRQGNAAASWYYARDGARKTRTWRQEIERKVGFANEDEARMGATTHPTPNQTIPRERIQSGSALNVHTMCPPLK